MDFDPSGKVFPMEKKFRPKGRLFDRDSDSRVYPEFLRERQLADLLSVSVFTVRKWRAQGRIPYRKFGRAIRYNYDEVVEAISERN